MSTTLDAPTRPDAPVLDETVSDERVWAAEELLRGYWRWRRRRLTHREVVELSRRPYGYEWVCRFFTLQVEDSAVRVNGSREDDYPVSIGLQIVDDFCARWNGCPEEACR